MKRRHSAMQDRRDEFEALRNTVAAMKAPRSQAEWRNVSRMLRTVRREAQSRQYGYTAKVQHRHSFRYLGCDTWSPRTFCYNGPSRVTYLAMMAGYRSYYMRGDKSRADGIRSFARASRADGPIPLPADSKVAA